MAFSVRVSCDRTRECAVCIANYKNHRNTPGHRYYKKRPKQKHSWSDTFVGLTLGWKDMKKKLQEESPTPKEYVPSPDTFYKRFPNIQRYMEEVWYDDGTPRNTANLKINSSGSGVQVILSDPDNEESIITQGDTVGEALAAVEECLKVPDRGWRKWPAFMRDKKGLTPKRK